MAHDEWLVPGEHLEWHADPLPEQTKPSDIQIDEKYVRGEIRIVIEQARYPLKQIPDIVGSADYNLQPDFQRRPRWSAEKQSRLIESFIMNVPVPPVFLYESEYSHYEVMDGRQRLTAISDFYKNDFRLEGLTEWPELNGRTYEELPDQVRRGIDRRYISSIVLLHETAKSPEEASRLKQLVFERINTGGEDLSAQEKRNALYPGRFNTLCITLSRVPSFCRLWDIPVPDAGELTSPNWQPPLDLVQNPSYKTMEDVELILRFFAHRQRRALWRTGGLEPYLTRYLIFGNQFSPATIEELGQLFRDTADLTYKVLGDTAFWLYRERKGLWTWIARPTYVAFEPIMFAFSRMLDKSETLIGRAAEIKGSLESFYRTNSATFDGRKVNSSDVERRDTKMFEHFNSFLG